MTAAASHRPHDVRDAHRLHHRDAAQILVLEGGRIVERARSRNSCDGGRYKQLYESQYGWRRTGSSPGEDFTPGRRRRGGVAPSRGAL